MLHSMVITNVFTNQRGEIETVEVCFFNKAGIEIIKMKLEARLIKANNIRKGMEVILVGKNFDTNE